MGVLRNILGSCALLWGACIAQPMRVENTIPSDFENAPYATTYLVTEQEPRRLPAPLVIDLATGAGVERCRDLGAWSGNVTYLNTDRGTLTYTGTGQGCITHGIGFLVDGMNRRYFGGVTTYTKAGEAPVISGDRIRIGVMEGYGREVVVALGAAFYGRFERGRLTHGLDKDAGFAAVLQAAQGSFADPAFPRFTPEVHRLLHDYRPGMRADPIPWVEIKAFYDVDFTKAQALTTPLVIDMANGAGAERCPRTPWTGEVTFLNTETGTLRYWGIGQGCHTRGVATVQYPDGKIYFGKVSTLVRGQWAAAVRSETRVGVPNGWGQLYDPATGQQQVGWFVDGVFKNDYAAEPSFQQAFLAIQASIVDKTAPTWTAAMHFLDWEWQRPAPPRPLIPDAMTVKYPNIVSFAEKARALINTDPDELPSSIKEGLFGGGCKAAPGERIVLSRPEKSELPFPLRSYVGEGKDCWPRGFGRIDYADGARWIGQVSPIEMGKHGSFRVPNPDGYGWWRRADGVSSIGVMERGIALCGLDQVRTPYWRVTFHAADFDDTGRVALLDQRWGTPDNTGVCSNLWAFSEHRAFHSNAVAAIMTVELPSGATITGQFKALAPESMRKYLYEHRVKGVRILGELRKSKTGFAWADSLHIELTRPVGSLPPGHYTAEAPSLASAERAKSVGLTVVDRYASVDVDAVLPVENILSALKLSVSSANSFRTAMAQGIKWQQDAHASAESRAVLEQEDRQATFQSELQSEARQRAEDEAASRQMWNNVMTGLQKSVAEGNARMQQTQQTAQGYIQRSNELEAHRQKGIQLHKQREEANKAELQGIIDAANSVKTPEYYANMKAAAAASGQTAQPPASGDDDAGPGVGDQRGAPKLPQGQQYGAIKDECGQLGRDYMAAKTRLEFRCQRPKRDDETFTAWRDAQNSCMADGKGEVEGLQVAYSACSKRDPSEGGVVRY
jgi:hypothetical protein